MAAVTALAHSGATGIVLERMNGMTAMRDIIGELAPMMQGEVPYDAFTVSEGGDIIAKHAGETMLALFPEGSLEGVTYAKPEIWAKWQDFADLAEELRVSAEPCQRRHRMGLNRLLRSPTRWPEWITLPWPCRPRHPARTASPWRN